MGCASKKSDKFEKAMVLIAAATIECDELMVILDEIAKEKDKDKYRELMVAWDKDYAAASERYSNGWALYWENASEDVIAENEAWKDQLLERVKS